jgi:large subunit ribosomal protein L32
MAAGAGAGCYNSRRAGAKLADKRIRSTLHRALPVQFAFSQVSALNFHCFSATPWKKAAFWLISCLSQTENQLNPRPLCWLADSNKTEKLAEAVMAVPKRKQSNSRTGKRRSHDRLTPKNLTVCRKCSASIPTHVVCPRCGYYNSRVVVPSKEEV